jgi:hypothetical protein
MPLAPLPGLPVWNPWACHEPRSCRPVRDPPACQRQSQFLIKCTDYRLSALTARARGYPGLDLSQQSAQGQGKLLHDKIVEGEVSPSSAGRPTAWCLAAQLCQMASSWPLSSNVAVLQVGCSWNIGGREPCIRHQLMIPQDTQQQHESKKSGDGNGKDPSSNRNASFMQGTPAGEGTTSTAKTPLWLRTSKVLKSLQPNVQH